MASNRLSERLVAGLVAFALAGACNAADIVTAAGTVTVEKTPEKIAVFDIAAIDTLDALGVKTDGIPPISTCRNWSTSRTAPRW
ncbi:hypothetical protein U8C40_32210 (plasmid) [Sinorhizobium medicae]|uniref:hypothetical protein n=1 Tax=Sinorhizobium medicae TaxID=110321 RepID=UPI002AF6B84A|nr:hypothetical protein [Sinorhizobium medicae]WQO50015.1 hypothetical protein U8C42_33200 [Sinorhizobium medicae]WQO70109.1 hypothetical protein U8C40_32210 [Sinorhizobium medicae]WQO77258.1 hypothetical protein U8C31_32525 [Sinorhizobium medicae]